LLARPERNRSEAAYFTSPEHTFHENRKTFQRIRADLQNLRTQIENKEEALAIIDNIMDELHEQRLSRSNREPVHPSTSRH